MRFPEAGAIEITDHVEDPVSGTVDDVTSVRYGYGFVLGQPLRVVYYDGDDTHALDFAAPPQEVGGRIVGPLAGGGSVVLRPVVPDDAVDMAGAGVAQPLEVVVAHVIRGGAMLAGELEAAVAADNSVATLVLDTGIGLYARFSQGWLPLDGASTTLDGLSLVPVDAAAVAVWDAADGAGSPLLVFDLPRYVDGTYTDVGDREDTGPITPPDGAAVAAAGGTVHAIRNATELGNVLRLPSSRASAWYTAKRADALTADGGGDVAAVVRRQAAAYLAACEESPHSDPSGTILRALIASARSAHMLRDPAVVAAINWREWLHPRGMDGRFIHKRGMVDVYDSPDGTGTPRRGKVRDLTRDGVVVDLVDKHGKVIGTETVGSDRLAMFDPVASLMVKPPTAAESGHAFLARAKAVYADLSAEFADAARATANKVTGEKMTPDEYKAHTEFLNKVNDRMNDDGLTLDKLMQDKNGRWDDSFYAWMLDTVDEIYDQPKYRDVPKDRKALMTGGLGGSGKSTTLKRLTEAGVLQGMVPVGEPFITATSDKPLEFTGSSDLRNDRLFPPIAEKVLPDGNVMVTTDQTGFSDFAVRIFDADGRFVAGATNAGPKGGDSAKWDLYISVAEGFRGKGYGSAMLDELQEQSIKKWGPDGFRVRTGRDYEYTKAGAALLNHWLGQKQLRGEGLPPGTEPRPMVNAYATINPDDMKEELIARGIFPDIIGMSPSETANAIHEVSSELASLLEERVLLEGHNVIQDITMGGGLKKRRDGRMGNKGHTVADKLVDAGYSDIDGVFVDIPVERSIEQALGRHRGGLERFRANQSSEGGRYVPPGVIEGNDYNPVGTRVRAHADSVADNPKKQTPNPLAFDIPKTMEYGDRYGTSDAERALASQADDVRIAIFTSSTDSAEAVDRALDNLESAVTGDRAQAELQALRDEWTFMDPRTTGVPAGERFRSTNAYNFARAVHDGSISGDSVMFDNTDLDNPKTLTATGKFIGVDMASAPYKPRSKDADTGPFKSSAKRDTEDWDAYLQEVANGLGTGAFELTVQPTSDDASGFNLHVMEPHSDELGGSSYLSFPDAAERDAALAHALDLQERGFRARRATPSALREASPEAAALAAKTDYPDRASMKDGLSVVQTADGWVVRDSNGDDLTPPNRDRVAATRTMDEAVNTKFPPIDPRRSA